VDISIIGAGNVGKALSTAFVRAGHTVTIASRDPEDAGAVATATGATVAASNAAAASAGEIVILAIPSTSFADVAAEIAPAVAGKPVVDVTNRIGFGANGPEIDTTSSNAEALAELLPEANVVKAFNTLFGSNMADPITGGVQLDGFVAGDDDDAKASVLELVGSVGLHSVDVGPLVRARQLEGLSFLNMTLNIVNGGTWQSGWKLVGAPEPAAEAA
jgi:NADPH-dependent F420 reductase